MSDHWKCGVCGETGGFDLGRFYHDCPLGARNSFGAQKIKPRTLEENRRAQTPFAMSYCEHDGCGALWPEKLNLAADDHRAHMVAEAERVAMGVASKSASRVHLRALLSEIGMMRSEARERERRAINLATYKAGYDRKVVEAKAKDTVIERLNAGLQCALTDIEELRTRLQKAPEGRRLKGSALNRTLSVLIVWCRRLNAHNPDGPDYWDIDREICAAEALLGSNAPGAAIDAEVTPKDERILALERELRGCVDSLEWVETHLPQAGGRGTRHDRIKSARGLLLEAQHTTEGAK